MSQRTDKKTICLNMIVKNESAIIRDTLENIIAHVPLDYYVISDTGSDDTTQKLSKSSLLKKALKAKFITINGLTLPIIETVRYNMHKEKQIMYSSLMQTTASREILYYLKS